MNEHIIPLSDTRRCVKAVCGAKSAALAAIFCAGIPVPLGFCIGAEIYRAFLTTTGLREKILMELGRKRYEDMRWEEMWDASLRIRNLFVKTHLPSTIRKILVGALKKYCPDKAVAIRSSSLAEDSAQASFAGIHESFINIKEEDEILKHIRLVWASLWSDAALAYRKELDLDITESAMSVIVQEMVCGEKSGVAFGINPQDTQQAVIECVYGLNKGLVDGDIEPDQWILDRQTGSILNKRIVEHSRYVVPSKEGVSFASRTPEDTDTPTLGAEEVKQVFVTLKKLEDIFGMPQDMEWTYDKGNLYVLQSRPITTVKNDPNNDRRSFDVSLRRSFESLKALGSRIENDLIPQLVAQANKLEKKKLDILADEELTRELEYRKNVFDSWTNVYWEDFIPFAHGVRLFGEVYNDKIAPDDPYEFVDLLTGSGMKSIERNHFLEKLASIQHNAEGESLPRDSDSFLSDFGVILSDYDTTEEKHKVLASFLKRLSRTAKKNDSEPKKDAELLKRHFIQSFSETEQPFAYDLLSLAQKSYQLRDDDNMYLGRIEEELNRAMLESRKSEHCMHQLRGSDSCY
jgi:pyruvate,water dikinase